ncbi:MAG: LytR family transcriptional regulator [bacterium]|nr:LytR family transcriptional regulator [Candidatus Aquidulcis frankliniae]
MGEDGAMRPAKTQPAPIAPANLRATLLTALLPGLGHLTLGDRRHAALFLTPVLTLAGATLLLVLVGGTTQLLILLVTPGSLALLGALNLLLVAWRLSALAHLLRGAQLLRRDRVLVAIATLLLVAAPHLAVGRSLIAFDELLNETFAETSPSPAPNASGSAAGSASPDASTEVSPGPSIGRGDGTGTLPSLTVTTPWARPGEIPWGDDGKFDLLLLGSDAGNDRWSRRMDVMLLVEVDVATGRVAMFGFPRNMVNVPLPPGAARNASPCGCFTKLLNEVYTDATFYYPQLWPGDGSVSGIAAVRATISELAQRPIDAVLVADLWGVIKVVDAMGGIDMNVTEPIYDTNYPDPVLGSIQLRIDSGLQHFNGRLALAYARSRHQDSDYGRMRRQQALLLAIRDQLGAATILNAPALAAAAKGYVWTDLPRTSLPNLVDLFSRAATAQVRLYRFAPSAYPAYLTAATIAKIRSVIASAFPVVASPSPSPSEVPSVSPEVPPSAPESTAP